MPDRYGVFKKKPDLGLGGKRRLVFETEGLQQVRVAGEGCLQQQKDGGNVGDTRLVGGDTPPRFCRNKDQIFTF